VDAFVLDQVAGAVKGFRTEFADIRTFECVMDGFVYFHVAHLRKCFVTQITWIRFLFSMLASVDGQLARGNKCFLAKIATVSLIARMSSLVPDESCLATKAHVTYIANVVFILRVRYFV